MSTTEERPTTPVRKAQDSLPSGKEVRGLIRRFKSGYRLERTGGGHYRIRDPHSRLVVTKDGKNLTIVQDPSPGVVRALEAELIEARVLRGTALRINDEGTKKRKEAQAETNRVRQQRRNEQAAELRNKLASALSFLGGLDKPGLTADLGYVGFMLAREEKREGLPPTPDLFSGNAYRLVHGAWVEPRYAAIWVDLAERVSGAEHPVEEWFSLVRRARGLPEEAVVRVRPADAEMDWPYTVELIPFDRLLVDWSYQRPVKWAFVRKEASRFDPTLVGTIDVSERERGERFAILDGQQRVEICRLVEKGTIWCSVYRGLDHASEARFFLKKNKDRNAMHPYYTFNARVAADDPEAIEIQRIVQEFGYVLSITAPKMTIHENHIAAIAAVEMAYERKRPDGSDTLTPTLAALKATTLGRAHGQNNVLIRGLSSLYQDYTEDILDDKIVREILLELGPELIVGRARDAARGSGGSATKSLRGVLRSEYDRRAGRERRLPR